MGHHIKDPSSPTIHMAGTDLPEASCHERLLGLRLTSDLKWNAYILSVAKEASKIIISLYRSRRFFTPKSILYIYKSQIRPRMEYCSHIWAGAAQTALASLDRVQKRLRRLIGDKLFKSLQPLHLRRNVSSLSLLYRYFHGQCSIELHAMVPPLKKYIQLTRSAEANHPYFLDIPRCDKEFHRNSFLPRTCLMWNGLPIWCFPDTFCLDVFKRNVNRQLSGNDSSSSSASSSLPSSSSTIIIINHHHQPPSSTTIIIINDHHHHHPHPHH